MRIIFYNKRRIRSQIPMFYFIDDILMFNFIAVIAISEKVVIEFWLESCLEMKYSFIGFSDPLNRVCLFRTRTRRGESLSVQKSLLFNILYIIISLCLFIYQSNVIPIFHYYYHYNHRSVIIIIIVIARHRYNQSSLS